MQHDEDVAASATVGDVARRVVDPASVVDLASVDWSMVVKWRKVEFFDGRWVEALDGRAVVAASARLRRLRVFAWALEGGRAWGGAPLGLAPVELRALRDGLRAQQRDRLTEAQATMLEGLLARVGDDVLAAFALVREHDRRSYRKMVAFYAGKTREHGVAWAQERLRDHREGPRGGAGKATTALVEARDGVRAEKQPLGERAREHGARGPRPRSRRTAHARRGPPRDDDDPEPPPLAAAFEARVSVPETRLQAAQRRVFEALAWARVSLDEREQRELLDFAVRLIALRVREQLERDLRRPAA